tara:strand:+ start:27374 stop:31204 length:3831 start_codon:yes stop_codon:yes gene_type:complete
MAINLTAEEVGRLTQQFSEMGMTLAEIIDHIDNMTEAQKRSAQESNSQIGFIEKRLELLRRVSAEQQQQGQWAENFSQQQTLLIQLEEERLELAFEQGKIDEEELQNGKLRIKQLHEENALADQAADKSVEVAQALTGVSGAWKGTVIGSFFQGDFEANLQRTAMALTDNFSAANMLGSALMRVQESTMMMVVSADAQFAEVNKLTNSTGEYNDMIMDTMQNNQQYNVSVEDAAESVNALFTEMSNFSNMSKEAQAAAVETTAQLKGLGIDAQTTAANFEILTGALGMSSAAAADVQKDFAAMAADLGVSAGKIAKDFERNSDVFTAYGDEAVRVFKETAAAAKATGIEMNALLGITTQFDTFEGAAKAAGQLNAVLGGGLLNSMDLLNASEEERVRMLIQSVEMSGKSFNQMSKFEKQAVMNAAGISDMTEANKLFGQSLAEYDAAQRKVEDNAEAQAKLEERAAAAANMQDKLKRIMEQFAVAVTPIINVIHFLLDGLLSLNDMTGGMLIPTLIGLAAAMMAIQHASKLQAMWSTIMTGKAIIQAGAEGGLAAAKGALTTATAAQTAAAPAASRGSYMMARGMSALGKAAAKAAPKIAAALGPIAGIAVAVAAPILLLAVIIWSMKELILAFMEAPEAIAPAILGLAAFIAVAAIGLPILAFAFASFFNILATAAPAMGILMPVLPTMAVSFGILAISLWLLGKAIQQFVGAGMPEAMVLALASLFAFGTGLVMLGPIMKKGFKKVGINVGILAVALLLLGMALKQWNDVGVDDAVLAYVSLWAFAGALIPLAFVMKMGAEKVGIAVGILGLGLLLLGKGLQEWNDVGLRAAFAAVAGLVVFGTLLILAAPFITKGTFLVGAAVGVLGIGLLLLAKGIKAFEDVSVGMILLPLALLVFGYALIPAGIALAIGGSLLLIGAVTATPALLMLAVALAPWMEMDYDKLRGLGSALYDMTDGMVWAGIKMAIAGAFLLFGGWRVALGLAVLWLGLAPWMTEAINLDQLPTLGWALAEFSMGLLIAGIYMAYAGIPFLFGAVLISLGLLVLNEPLKEFANTLAVLAPVAPLMPAIGVGLRAIGNALPSLGWGIFQLGIAASMPFFKTGLKTLGRGLRMFAAAVSNIPEEKALALGALFQSLSKFTALGKVGGVLRSLGWGIWAIGAGLKNMPEGVQAVQFSVAAESLAELAAEAVDLTPEAVENVQNLADAAIDYGIASRLMRTSEDDALVSALKELAGIAKGSAAAGAKGQDVVLEIDGKEFARAVSAAIDSKHNMPF